MQAKKNGDILLRLKQELSGYSPALCKLGRFILTQPHRTLYLTITELARESDTSEASVTRLCRTLGCAGYTEFKMALALDIQPMTPPSSTNDDDSSTLIEECVTALRDTGKLLQRNDLARGGQWLHQARSVQMYGVAASAIVGDYLHYKFLRLGKLAQSFTDMHRAAMNAVSLTPEDVAIAISSSGSTKDVLYVARKAKEHGARVIALSNTSRSPLADLADILLVAAKPEGPLTAGALNSKVGVMLLVELLIMELIKCDPRYQIASRETAGATLPMLL